ncbi:Hypothetical predicted protein [Mytilus galloprovincialis]|uniref:CCHC-type domain-containing protein n=1 Tax=Mytilus galloprovincialis TaxID=29158 RepID=A0A8B6C7C6_MYTGA|nr:Hypothetical predicted protein [Mytilus galloprovincialis]
MDYKLKQRFNRWCPPDLRKHYNMNSQPCFVENGNYPIRSDFHRVTNSNIDKTVRCFRYGQTGHFYKQCEEIRIKSKEKLNRDLERLSIFIQRKTQEIDFLKQENRTLKSKLQKKISKSTELSREIEIRNLENDKLERTIRTLYTKIAGLDVSELANQKKMKDLITSCRKLETEINALRQNSCDCKIPNPSMSRPIQNKGQNVNHDPSRRRNPSRGRRRQHFLFDSWTESYFSWREFVTAIFSALFYFVDIQTLSKARYYCSQNCQLTC